MTWRDRLALVAFTIAIALTVAACHPALVNVPTCPACAPAPAPVVVSLPSFPSLPRVTHIGRTDASETCYDATNYAALQRRASLILCDDCTLRRRAVAAGHVEDALPAECVAHPECR